MDCCPLQQLILIIYLYQLNAQADIKLKKKIQNIKKKYLTKTLTERNEIQ